MNQEQNRKQSQLPKKPKYYTSPDGKYLYTFVGNKIYRQETGK